MPKKTLGQRYRNQLSLMEKNGDEVLSCNYSLLRRLLSVAVIIFAGLLVISLLVDSFVSLKAVYIVMLAVAVVLCLLYSFRALKRFTLPGLYLIFVILLGFTTYLSAIVYPEQRATCVIGLLCLMPLVILDYSWRIDLITVCFFTVHSVFSWMLKPPSIATDDLVTTACFCLIGLLIGERSRSAQLENFDLKRQANRDKEIDFLTGLYNRRKMFEMLEKAQTAPEASGVSGIMMLDVDYFKRYNDCMGHLAGDDCLCRLSALLTCFGEENRLDLFRYGGEEFLVFAYRQQGDELKQLAEKLRLAVWELALPFSENPEKRVTISIGILEVSRADCPMGEQMIRLADEALYCAKNAGRNCVMVSPGK